MSISKDDILFMISMTSPINFTFTETCINCKRTFYISNVGWKTKGIFNANCLKNLSQCTDFFSLSLSVCVNLNILETFLPFKCAYKTDCRLNL